MSLTSYINEFSQSERGAITVDWTALSALAIGFALATAAVMTDVSAMVSGNMNSELENRSMADDWIGEAAPYFAPLIESGYMTEGQANYLHSEAFDLMNNDVMTQLEAGIAALEAGTITTEELIELIGIAAIAHQRNLVSDATLDHYFGFDGGDALYLQAQSAPDASDAPYSGESCNMGQGGGDGNGCIYGGGQGSSLNGS